jgi:4-amino-4-deoxy-L-arabinose transferase-like glycosyltransferase
MKSLSNLVARPRAMVLLAMAIAFAIRLAVAALLPDQTWPLPDSVGYREAALQLWHGFHIENSGIMPLYPALIFLTGKGWGQALFDIALSSLMVWLIYELTLIVFSDTRAALLAAFAATFYPHFIFFSVVGLTETLFITLLLSAYLCWYRGWFAFAALFAVLSILTRPVIDLLTPILIVYFALAIHRLPLLATLRQLGIYIAIYCVLMAPWWLHNYRAYHTFVRLNLGAGEALYSGNNPYNRTGGIDVDLGAHTVEFQKIADPVDRDRALQRAALAHILENPRQFVEQAGLKFLRFWRLWPHTESYNGGLFVIASLLSFLPAVLLAAFYLALRGYRDFRRIAPLLLLGGYLTAIHMILPGSIRYRLPIEPFLLVLAAEGASIVLAWTLARRIPRTQELQTRGAIERSV